MHERSREEIGQVLLGSINKDRALSPGFSYMKVTGDHKSIVLVEL